MRETTSFIEEYDVLSWELNENIPEGWKPEEESITPRSQQSKKPRIVTINQKVEPRVKLNRVENEKVEFVFRIVDNKKLTKPTHVEEEIPESEKVDKPKELVRTRVEVVRRHVENLNEESQDGDVSKEEERLAEAEDEEKKTFKLVGRNCLREKKMEVKDRCG